MMIRKAIAPPVSIIIYNAFTIYDFKLLYTIYPLIILIKANENLFAFLIRFL